jgi:hypothetical protein
MGPFQRAKDAELHTNAPVLKATVPPRAHLGNRGLHDSYRPAAAPQPSRRKITAPTSDPTQTKETAVSHTVPSQHPAVVLRSNYQLLRALLAVAAVAIVGLTIAVVVLATSNTTTITPASHHTAPATSATPSAETGAKLDHRGVKTTTQELRTNLSYFYPGHY